MTFIEELQRAFSQFQSMLIDDQNEDILCMSYAEFTLNCYVGYADRLYSTLLRAGAPMANAFCAIGIDMPRDQLLILLDSFYLHLHTDEKRAN